jgi:hypothetical protein
MSFTPPTDLTPYLPPANHSTVKKVASTPRLDIYDATSANDPGFNVPFAVLTGTATGTVQAEGDAALSWYKLSVAYPSIVQPGPDRDAANRWFNAEIRPAYPPY